MPGKRVSMRKTREVLRLYFDLKLGQRQIARSASVSQSTVHDYLERFTAAGLSWPLPTEMTEAELEAALFPADPRRRPAKAGADSPVRCPTLRTFTKSCSNTSTPPGNCCGRSTARRIPDGYNYSRFCYLYQRWKRERDVVLRQEHRPGEKLFVDWAGATMPIHDPQTGEKFTKPRCSWPCSVPATTPTPKPARISRWSAWIGAHVRTFEFLGGCPELVVPDNTKTGVAKPCRYEPDLNPTYQEMAAHYGVGVLPARPR